MASTHQIETPVYLTFKWTDKEADSKFEELEKHGFVGYRWDLASHTGLARALQFAKIKDFVNTNAKAFVIVIEDPKYEYTGSSQILAHVAMSDWDMPVVVVDPFDGEHAEYIDTHGNASKQHRLVRNLGGAYLKENNRLIVTKTLAEGLVALRAKLDGDDGAAARTECSLL